MPGPLTIAELTLYTMGVADVQTMDHTLALLFHVAVQPPDETVVVDE